MGVLKYIINIHFIIVVIITAIAILVFGVNPWVALLAAIIIYGIIQLILYVLGRKKIEELPHENKYDLIVIPGFKKSTQMQKVFADVCVLGDKQYGYETMTLTGKARGFCMVKTIEGKLLDGKMDKKETQKGNTKKKLITYEALLMEKGFMRKSILIYPGEKRKSPLTSQIILLDGVSVKQIPIAKGMKTEIFTLQWIGKKATTERIEIDIISDELFKNIALSAVNNLGNASENATKFNVVGGIKKRERTGPM